MSSVMTLHQIYDFVDEDAVPEHVREKVLNQSPDAASLWNVPGVADCAHALHRIHEGANDYVTAEHPNGILGVASPPAPARRTRRPAPPRRLRWLPSTAPRHHARTPAPRAPR